MYHFLSRLALSCAYLTANSVGTINLGSCCSQSKHFNRRLLTHAPQTSRPIILRGVEALRCCLIYLLVDIVAVTLFTSINSLLCPLYVPDRFLYRPTSCYETSEAVSVILAPLKTSTKKLHVIGWSQQVVDIFGLEITLCYMGAKLGLSL
jgi:hypothetical protein